ncbi:MAG: gliding motility-associated C-terminal domain-containing protein [Hymenobacteraceae bacterium]|nr:gliding motility-associated C-terminal domain-containing protein [Hymenobacteraceae bacterium]MDX5396154.1 gliding motility-associated C-terminal domain-containing protein [Hymenobacteraceae bacterium]MDX5443048.1 gliding motility-associated C-terminal domain-containing protein [Hymenobacteraceae bacterium]MDX5512217.1 gliding motility-associated C-terminal domain-containing protein [Hymenobacteraceae bacterium]
MQDKDFDSFIRKSLEDYTPEDFNPADWDKMEDQLVNMNQPAPTPAKAFKFGAGKAGFAASMVVLTAVNLYLYTNKPAAEEIAKPTATLIEQQPVAELKAADEGVVPYTAAEKEADEAAPLNQQSEGAAVTELAAATKSEIQVSETAALTVKALPETGNKTVAQRSEKAGAGNKQTATPATQQRVQSAQLVSRPMLPKTAVPASGNTLYAGKPVTGGVVVNCAGNNLPEVPYLLHGQDTIRDFKVVAKACEPLALRIVSKDKNQDDKLVLSSNATVVLENSSFVVSEAAQPVAWMQWLPTADNIRQEPYLVNVAVADNRCPDKIKNYQIAVQVVAPVALQLAGDTLIEKGEGSRLAVKGAGKNALYSWTPQDGSLSATDVANPEARPLVTTMYTVAVTTPSGCTFTDSIKVLVKEEQPIVKEAKVNIPNAFTPNNDGKNDYFVVENLEPGTYKLEVFNRWGKSVYSSDRYDNTWSAEGLSNDTYFYRIIVSETQQTYKGWVEVIR